MQRQRERDAMWPRPQWSGAIILVVLVLMLASAATSHPAAAVPVTTSDVYRNVAKALDRSGQTFLERWTFATMITDTSKSTKTATTTTEHVWADARNNRTRGESLGQPLVIGAVINSKREHTASSALSPGQNTAPSTCQGATATVSFVLQCPEDPSTSVQSVTSGRWHGRDAVVLVTTRMLSKQLTDRLYLDPKTWLPFARTETGIPSTSDPVRLDSSGSISSTFVETAHLPRSFFTAASIDKWASSHAT